MEPRARQGRMLWGVVLVVLGLLFLSSNFGYQTWFVWDRWWPLLLIAIGVAMIYRRNQGAGEPGAPSSTVPGPSSGGPMPVGRPPLPGEGPAPTPPAAPRRRYPTGAIILIGIGVAFLLDDVIGGDAFPALVLVVIGIALILRERAAS